MDLRNEELKDEFGLKLGDRKKLLARILELKQANREVRGRSWTEATKMINI